MLKNVSLVKKIYLVLFLPLILLVFFLGQNIFENRSLQTDIQHQEYLAKFCEKLGNLVDAISLEQSQQLFFLLNKEQTNASSLLTICQTVDQNKREIDIFIKEFNTHYTNERERFDEIFNLVTSKFYQITDIRARIMARTITFEECKTYYNELGSIILNNYNELPKWGKISELSNYLYSLAYLSAEQTQMIRGGFQMWKGIVEGQLNSMNFVYFDRSIFAFLEYEELFDHLLSLEQRAMYRKTMQHVAVIEFKEMAQRIREIGPEKPLKEFDAAHCWQNIEVVSKLIQEVETTLTQQLNQTVDQYKMRALYNILLTCFTLVAVTTAVNVMTWYIMRFIRLQLGEITTKLDKIAQKDLTQHIDLEGTDEFGMLAQMINDRVLISFKEAILRMQGSSTALKTVTQELSTSSREIATTSNQQAAGVKEIVSTMEDTDSLAKQVANKVRDVLQVVHQSQEEINKGFELIQQNQNKMEEINHGNSTTIEGIHLLGQQINSIWDIVNLINNIADQTKIIAFNAELEASSAGEAGKNFQIVATEIRRLADNTVVATNSIKAKINETQKSSDLLVVTAETGSTRVQEGCLLSNHLNTVFQNILKASEVTVHSSEEVVHSIQQQVGAFEQILLTMKQIAESINNFNTATGETSKTAVHLQNMSEQIDALIQQYRLPT